MNKKGLSPLSSTMILLGISLVIGVMVMTWGRSYVEQATAGIQPDTAQGQQQASVLQDLNTRLASGEISKEQYDKIKEVLLTQQNGK